MAKGKTQQYYDSHPKARAVKKKKDKEINSRPEQRKKRSELVQKNRDADKKGVNRKGKDYDHSVGKHVSVKTNRGRKGEGGRTKGKSHNKK